MGHICALLLSGSDIRFLGTIGPEPEPYSKKQPDIWPSGTGYPVHPYRRMGWLNKNGVCVDTERL